MSPLALTPQLNFSSSLWILMFTWLVLTSLVSPKILALSFPKKPMLQKTMNQPLNTWKWMAH